MSQQDELNSIRVVDRPTTLRIIGVDRRTWDRLEARGETPPKTKLSPNRIGYRLVDLQAWLDARRVGQVAPTAA